MFRHTKYLFHSNQLQHFSLESFERLPHLPSQVGKPLTTYTSKHNTEAKAKWSGYRDPLCWSLGEEQGACSPCSATNSRKQESYLLTASAHQFSYLKNKKKESLAHRDSHRVQLYGICKALCPNAIINILAEFHSIPDSFPSPSLPPSLPYWYALTVMSHVP